MKKGLLKSLAIGVMMMVAATTQAQTLYDFVDFTTKSGANNFNDYLGEETFTNSESIEMTVMKDLLYNEVEMKLDGRFAVNTDVPLNSVYFVHSSGREGLRTYATFRFTIRNLKAGDQIQMEVWGNTPIKCISGNAVYFDASGNVQDIDAEANLYASYPELAPGSVSSGNVTGSPVIAMKEDGNLDFVIEGNSKQTYSAIRRIWILSLGGEEEIEAPTAITATKAIFGKRIINITAKSTTSQGNPVDIYYTLNGSDPDYNDWDNTFLVGDDMNEDGVADTIFIDQTTTIKARAYKTGAEDQLFSEVFSQTIEAGTTLKLPTPVAKASTAITKIEENKYMAPYTLSDTVLAIVGQPVVKYVMGNDTIGGHWTNGTNNQAYTPKSNAPFSVYACAYGYEDSDPLEVKDIPLYTVKETLVDFAALDPSQYAFTQNDTLKWSDLTSNNTGNGAAFGLDTLGVAVTYWSPDTIAPVPGIVLGDKNWLLAKGYGIIWCDMSKGTNSGNLVKLDEEGLAYEIQNDDEIGFFIQTNNSLLPTNESINLRSKSRGEVLSFNAVSRWGYALTAIKVLSKTVDETGITDVKTKNTVNNAIYTINGVRVSKPTRGLYIINGKKIFVK